MSTDMIEQPETTEQPEHDADTIRAEVDAVDVGGFAQTEDDAILHRYLRRRSQLAAEITHVKEQTDAMLRQLQNQLNGIDYVYGPIVHDIARRKLDGKKQKSLKTPFGTVGFRKVPGGINVTDEETLIGMAALNGTYEKFVAVKRVVVKSAVNEHFKQSGEVLPGCEAYPEREKFFVS
jgi:phage host-nuclease inhibitor protein Gam